MFLLTGCDSKENKYIAANEAYQNGDYQKAYDILDEIGDYRNSKDLRKDLLILISGQDLITQSKVFVESIYDELLDQGNNDTSDVQIAAVDDGEPSTNPIDEAMAKYRIGRYDEAIVILDMIGDSEAIELKGRIQSDKDTVETYYEWDLKGEGDSLRLTKYLGFSKRVIDIPYGVVELRGTFSSENIEIEQVNTPDTVRVLADRFISGCPNLKHFEITSGVEKLEFDPFGNSALVELHIPNTVKEISHKAKYINGFLPICSDSKYLESVVIEAPIPDIPRNAFENCSALVTITLPATLETIGSEAFKNCISLQEINSLDNIVTIKSGAFSGCTSLVDIHLSEKTTAIGQSAFERCENIQYVRLPLQLEELDVGVFNGCVSLEEVILPSNLQAIRSDVFSNCTSLKELKIYGKVKNIDRNAFGPAWDNHSTRGNISDKVTLYVIEGTPAHRFASENYMRYGFIDVDGKITQEPLMNRYQVIKADTVAEAFTYCTQNGGHLATITSQEEQDYILGAFGNGYYIGLQKVGNSWEWVTGEPVTYTNWSTSKYMDEWNAREDYTYCWVYDNVWSPDRAGERNNWKEYLCEWDN